MKLRLSPAFCALGLLLPGGCAKPKETPPAATAPAPERKGNWAEAMGINPEGEGMGRESAPPSTANPPAPPSRPIRRTLTAADGRTLDATLLSRTDSAVRVRRQADGQEFVIPLEKLSAADREFIRAGDLPTTPEG